MGFGGNTGASLFLIFDFWFLIFDLLTGIEDSLHLNPKIQILTQIVFNFDTSSKPFTFHYSLFTPAFKPSTIKKEPPDYSEGP